MTLAYQQIDTVLTIFEQFRMAPTAIDRYYEEGREVLKSKISSFISNNKPIDFVMLGFPFKSINIRDKVLGALPDMGEQLTFENFARFNALISEQYSPGINMVMASDGYAFNDVLKVSDQTVAQYREMAEDMGRIAPVEWFDILVAYGKDKALSGARFNLMKDHGVEWIEIQQRILFDPDVNMLYRGMIKFMEEEIAMREFPSHSQQNKQAKLLAREMMIWNEAYSGLVSSEFKNHIRLSMHPSINNGAKYSFQLIPSEKAHHSPWHSSIIKNKDGSIETIHKKDAIAKGAQIVSKDGRPYYFTEN